MQEYLLPEPVQSSALTVSLFSSHWDRVRSSLLSQANPALLLSLKTSQTLYDEYSEVLLERCKQQ